jgi:hypothetical protein
MTYVEHFAVGLLFLVTGWLIRSTCEHRGILPHPRQQIALAVLLCLLETLVVVPLIG